MEPLDLRTTVPRGPRAQLAGIMFMPRTIDKLRAEQPGGHLGEYLNRGDGLSEFMCRKLGLKMEELRAVVASANDEDDVAVWLAQHVDPELIAPANEKMQILGIHRLKPEDLEKVKAVHPIVEQRPDLQYFFDIFEADEASSAPVS